VTENERNELEQARAEAQRRVDELKLVLKELKPPTLSFLDTALPFRAVREASAADLVKESLKDRHASIARRIPAINDLYLKSVLPDLTAALGNFEPLPPEFYRATVGETLAGLFQSEKAALRLVEQSPWQDAALKGLLAETNSSVARAVADAAALATVAVQPPGPGAALAGIAVKAAQAFDTYFADVASATLRSFADRTPRELNVRTNLAVPSLSTSLLMGSTRSILVPPSTRSLHPARRAPRRRARVDSLKLDAFEPNLAYLSRRFRGVGAPFARRWEGAWSTLDSDSPDRFAQAASSVRELIIQLLDHLAPDHVFRNEQILNEGHDGKPTRRMRAKWILRGSGTRAILWVESVARTLESMHDFFAAEQHSRESSVRWKESDLAAAIMSVGWMLEFVISRYELNRQK